MHNLAAKSQDQRFFTFHSCLPTALAANSPTVLYFLISFLQEKKSNHSLDANGNKIIAA